MKEMKRVLALVLCFVMLVGILPVGALAAETETTAPSETVAEAAASEAAAAVETTAATTEATDATDATEETDGDDAYAIAEVSYEASSTDYLFVATDRHANTTIIGNIIDNMESNIQAQLDYVALGGDMVGSGNSHPEYDSSEVLAEVTGAASYMFASNVDIVAGIHDKNVNDDADIVLPYTGGGAQIYEGEDFYVYGVEEYCISDDSTESYWTTEAEKFVNWANSVADTSKAIIVVSHYPLHAKRDDNDGAYIWHTALNDVATNDAGEVVRNVVFFHGHNHTVDSNEYVYNVGDTMSIQNGSNTTSEKIQYTYATAGYLKENSKATLVTITDSTIYLEKYTTSGEGETMAEIARVVEETEPVKTISYVVLNEGAGSAYAVGDPCLLYEVVVNYTDGTSETVTQDVCECVIEDAATSETVDMATALNTVGSYAATISYQGYTCGSKLYFTVSEASELPDGSSYDTLSLLFGEGVTLTGDVQNVTENENVAAAMASVEGIGSYVAYDISATLAEGETATLSIPIPEGWDTDSLTAYHITDEGEVSDETFEGSYADGYYTFTVSHFSTYLVGEAGKETPVEKEPTTGKVEDSVSGTKTVYVLVDEAIAVADSEDEAVEFLIVSSNSDGSAYALGQNTTGVGVTVNKADSTVPAPYIETTATNVQWKYYTASSYSRSYNVLQNGSYYLRYSNSSLSFSTSQYSSWTLEADSLYAYSSSNYRYVYNSSGTWGANTTSSNKVYFYQKMDIDVNNNGTYAINGNPASVSMVVTESNKTVDLGSTLTFTPSVTGSLPVDTDVSERANYTVDTDTAGIIAGLSDNTVTFNTGVYGTALVKVSYTGTYTTTAGGTGSYTVTNYITVEAKAPYNDIEVYLTSDETTAVDTLPVKGVQNSTVRELTAALWQYAGGDEPTELTTAQLTWSVVSDPSGILDADAAFTANGTNANTATSTNSNVTLNFSGNGGIATIRVQYTDGTYKDVTITAAVTSYYVPEDGTNDFPDYPDEGAVVIDKTATAVGDFNKTGIAQVELNMFGVPVSGSEPVDVVLVVDLSSSMEDNNRFTYAQEASKAFVTGLATNPDNRLAIVSFNSNSATSGTTNLSLRYLTEENVTAANTAIDNYSRATGTNYIAGLNTANSILTNNKIEGRKQFMVFLSDGAPTRYRPVSSTSDSDYENFSNGGDSTEEWISNGARSSSWEYEYYTTAMKAAGITVYTVGLGLNSSDYQPQYLLNDMSGPAGESTADNDTGTEKTKLDKYYFEVADSNSADALSAVFSKIASEIAAASNVSVNDLIADDYSMIFELPENITAEDTNGQEFFIEVVNYELDENHDRTGASESLLRVYMNEDGSFSAYTVSTTAAGVETKTPVTTTYAAKGEGEKGYFNVSGSTYTYVADGTGTHNITAGVYSQGEGDSLILVTPYFTYIGADQDLTWTTDQLSDTKQIAIRYFVYLNGSAGNLNSDDQEVVNAATKPGVYETNVKATVTYTNHLGNECQQTFPVPQMTWSGAQVGVTFYLVNAKGEPINRSGQVVPLPAAAFVTETFYESVVWNAGVDAQPLKANILAKDHLPEQYTLYDSNASYTVHVYKDADGTDLHNFFVINGSAEGTTDAVNSHMVQSDNTTQVYNTITGTKKNAYGGYSATMDEGDTITYSILDENGNEQSATATVVENTGDSIDYSSTNVAFAVLWIPTLAEDTIVVDYGLPVAINVVQNDQLMNTVNSLGTVVTNTAIEMNTGHTSSGSPIGCEAGKTSYTNSTLYLENGDRVINYGGLLYYVQNDMEFNEPTEFYYDTQASFTQENVLIEGYMYSKVTVVPATTVYYEDTFTDGNGENVIGLTYYEGGTPYTGRDRDDSKGWVTEGTTKANAVQGTDRPGDDKYHLPGYDADNPYGYDPVYNDSTQFSLGSAAMVNVSGSNYATAEFDFYGTGFDLISMTSSDTGYIILQVFDENGNNVANRSVDTYYGYNYGLYDATYKWDGYNWFLTDVATATKDTADEALEPLTPADAGTSKTITEWLWQPDPTDSSIYQVPVIKHTGLPWGKYRVVVTIAYSKWLDHNDPADNGNYDFYLDAVRIYDPIATTEIVTPDDPETEDKDEEVTVGDIYVKDGEGYPIYKELRDILIGKNDYDAVTEGQQTEGAIFIDDVSNTGYDKTYSITDYTNYGPNNEVYLASGQTIAFELDLSSYGEGVVADVQIGMKSANGTEVLASLGVDGVATNPATITEGKSSTDRYYSIGGYVNKTGKTILSFTNSSTEDGTLLSVTNLKLTFTKQTTLASGTYNVSSRVANAVLMMLSAEPEEEAPVVLPDAELEVSVNGKNLKVGNTVTVKATTSADVDYLTVNGQEVTEYKQNKKTGKRTWTVKVKAEEAGDMDIVVIAYADGYELETVTETISVAEKNNGKANKVVGQLLEKLFG